MSSPEKTIRIDKALEFAIFSGVPLNLFPDGSPSRSLVVNIVEVERDYVLVAASIASAADVRRFGEQFRENRLVGTFNYRDELLCFSTQLIPVGEASPDGHLRLAKPVQGVLRTRRRSPRIPFAGATKSLRAAIEIATPTGNLKFETTAFSDVSDGAIALFLPRQSGLVLPGDTVGSLKIYENEKLLLESSGIVRRVEPRRSSPSLGKSYSVVIEWAKTEPSKILFMRPLDRDRSESALPAEPSAAFVTFTHPFLPQVGLNGSLCDLWASGVSFTVGSTRFPILEGMFLHDLELQLPFQPRFRVALRVVRCERIETAANESRYKVRGEFKGISADFVKAVSEVVQNQNAPGIFDAGAEDHQRFWEFLFETGFIYRDKRKQLQNNAANLFKTYERLLNAKSPIVKKLLFKERGEIKGHVSAIRIYDDAWIIQHLNAAKTKESTSAAREVIMSIADFFLDPKSNEEVGNSFMACFYRPDNLYPAVLFGEVKQFVQDASICESRDLEYCVREGTELAIVDDATACREATPEDLEALEQRLVERGDYHSIRLEGLTVEKIKTLRVSDEFARLGLYRRRRVFVAEAEEGKRAFAVCNYASPGINLSELTNSIRLYYGSADAERDARLTSTLVTEAVRSYAATEMASPILLLDPGGTPPRGYQRAKTYRYWSFDLRHTKLFKAGAEHVFANLKELIRKYRSTDEKAVG